MARDIDPNLEYELFEAVAAGDTEAVADLLQRGIGLRAWGEYKRMPLTEAVELGHDKIASLLIAHGAPLDHVDAVGETALTVAVVRGDAAMVQLLLQAGASPEAGSGMGSALMAAAGRRRIDLVRLLLEAGADPNTEDVDECTAVDCVLLSLLGTRFMDPEPVQQLFQMARDHQRGKKLKPSRGFQLQCAPEELPRYLEIVSLLRAYGGRVGGHLGHG